MDDEERLAQLSNDLNEAHTLVEIARRTVWSAESDPEGHLDEPSTRMRRVSSIAWAWPTPRSTPSSTRSRASATAR